MSTKRRKVAEYKSIWRKHNGPIPRGYHIHHVDGNCLNNDISNLVCITAREHYDIHFAQGDYGACWALLRTGHLNLTCEERSEISRLTQKKRVDDGTHHFLMPDWRRDYKGTNNPNYGHCWTVEQKTALSKLRKANGKSAGKNNPMYGRKRSDLSAMNVANKGKLWYTDGVVSKQYFPSDVPDGWYRGRIIRR
jgi:hypothetical protein